MTDSPKVVLCNDCKMWFDASLPACPSCDHERAAYNHALKKSVDTSRLNAALATQVGHAQADARAQQQFSTARRTGNAELANRPLNNYPGYNQLVSSIKNKLADSNFGG